jgi:hypothetical protein
MDQNSSCAGRLFPLLTGKPFRPQAGELQGDPFKIHSEPGGKNAKNRWRNLVITTPALPGGEKNQQLPSVLNSPVSAVILIALWHIACKFLSQTIKSKSINKHNYECR